MTHLNRVVLQVDSQQWGVGGQLGHLCTTQDDISSFRSIILFTSLKSSTLLLLAQNSSKLVMCSTPKHHHEQWTMNIHQSILARWSPERSAILLLAISMVWRLLPSKPLRIRCHQWNEMKWNEIKYVHQKEYVRCILPTSWMWDHCLPHIAPPRQRVFPILLSVWCDLPEIIFSFSRCFK